MDPVQLLDAAKMHARDHERTLYEIGKYICKYYNELRGSHLFSGCMTYPESPGVHIIYDNGYREHEKGVKIAVSAFSTTIYEDADTDTDAVFLTFINKVNKIISAEDYIASNALDSAPASDFFAIIAADEKFGASRYKVAKKHIEDRYRQWPDVSVYSWSGAVKVTINKDFSVKIVLRDLNEVSCNVFVYWMECMHEYFEGHPDVKVATQ